MTTREQYMLMGPAGVIRECESLGDELAAVRTALDECDLIPVGTLADRIRMLTQHHRRWKEMFAEVSNRREAERDYAGLLFSLLYESRAFIAEHLPIKGRINAALAKNPNPAGGSPVPAAAETSAPVGEGFPEIGQRNCPTCDGHDPALHPAVQSGGEVHLCEDPWHKPTAAEIRAKEQRSLAVGTLRAAADEAFAAWLEAHPVPAPHAAVLMREGFRAGFQAANPVLSQVHPQGPAESPGTELLRNHGMHFAGDDPTPEQLTDAEAIKEFKDRFPPPPNPQAPTMKEKGRG